ncbi:DNA replication/repair protein RecF [Thermoflexus sp.]|uniref:DNA replication/repair protein RecF n=2 Tax=Thermoflexus sp. TaxID=1969742 RepID=UPI0025CFA189|nr:DNA replication/repair protein RecF [Thermoflexus sp.]MCS6964823.1 DNA replication/repair protein RecF [Thermoflexus sp.]MCX7689813.1 DNA replication/repair protein RecF [Thermoflexus sp.]
MHERELESFARRLGMWLRSLSLTQFRNYARLEWRLEPRVIMVYGGNAQGKTNLLEAIAYAAMGHSFRTSSDRELIHWAAWQDPMPFARVIAEFVRKDGPVRLELALVAEGSGPSQSILAPETAPIRKQARINGIPHRVLDLFGQAAVVLFTPQDVEVVGGPPVERRRLLDLLIAQTSPAFARILAAYQRALSQRNALLRRLQEEGSDPAQLDLWDESVARYGAPLMDQRARALQAIARYAEDIHKALSGGEPMLLRYVPSLDPFQAEGQMALGVLTWGERLQEVELRETFRRALLRERSQDIRRGTTRIGPHRDDFRFIVDGVDVGLYGSRGQQRTAILAFKLAAARWLASIFQESPVLLLDEVMAELDGERRRYLLRALEDVEQAIVTTTDPMLFEPEFRERVRRFVVRAGFLREER